VKDGIRNTVVVGRRENNEPFMGFTDAGVPTDEPNGVSITIPTSNVSAFDRALQSNFFVGWEPGTILVNGKAPEVSVHNPKQYSYVKDMGWIPFGTTNSGRTSVVQALVGPVLYTLEMGELNPHGWSPWEADNPYNGVILEVPIGSVEIAPNRESLIYGASTRKALKAKLKLVLVAVSEKYRERVKNAETAAEAIRLYQRAKTLGLDVKDYTWHDHGFSDLEYNRGWLKEIDPIQDIMTVSREPAYRSSQRMTMQHSDVHVGSFAPWNESKRKHVLITGAQVDPKSPNPRRRLSARGAAAWLRDKENSSLYTLYFTERKDISEFNFWAQQTVTQVMTAEEFDAEVTSIRKAAARVNRAEAAKRRKERTSDQLTLRVLSRMHNGSGYPRDRRASEFDVNDTFVYVKSGTEFTKAARTSLHRNPRDGKPLFRVLEHVLSGEKENVHLIFLNKNESLAHHKAVLPNLVSLQDHLLTLVKNLPQDGRVLSADQLDGLHLLSQRDHQWLWRSRMVLPLIESDETKAWINAATSAKAPEEIPAWVTRLTHFVNRIPAESDPTLDELRKALAGVRAATFDPAPGRSLRYPLLRHISSMVTTTAEDAAEYINWRDSVIDSEKKD
jgi:hypothetical protein